MFKITDENYKQYKSVFEIIYNACWAKRRIALGLDEKYSPLNIAKRMEKESKTLAKRGLKETLRDTFTRIAYLPADKKNEINTELLSKGLPSLNKLISTINDTPAKVLKRGRIKNLDEYYIIKEVICDVDSDIQGADRIQLDKLFTEFEMDQGKKKNAG